jgi:dTDP-4-dehydrorhamnose 3,5-epimerase
LFDVIVDLRPESPTYLQWLGVELTAKNRRTLYVPAGFAHGFQTLEDATEVFYLMSEFHTPEAEAGARWDDPAFGIIWPGAPERIISKKDQAWPPYQRSSVGARD